MLRKMIVLVSDAVSGCPWRVKQTFKQRMKKMLRYQMR